MADLLKAPDLLSVSYRIDGAPSALSKPYDLRATYDENAGGDTQSINGIGFSSLVIGNANTSYTQHIVVNGFDTSLYGNGKSYNSRQHVRPSGFFNTSFGEAILKNKNQSVLSNSFNSSLYGRPTIYNLRQYVIDCGGFHSAVFGTAYMQGGVKFVNTYGLNTLAFPTPIVINTRADQDARPIGIAPPLQQVSNPNVSPRTIRPVGIIGWSFGTAWVQRNPSPKGFINDSYGIAWVSHSPRYITPDWVQGFQPGYPKAFDPTQKIRHEGSPHIPGGIFGDIAVKNTRRILSVQGENQSRYGDWTNLYSNLTKVTAQSFDAQAFGTTNIRNKTPSVNPNPFEGSAFGTTFISDRVRRVIGRGIEMAESQRFGIHTLSKPPEIKPGAISALSFGNTWISNKRRNLTPSGFNSLQFSGAPIVWFRYRHIGATGVNFSIVASPKIEHGLRNLVANGSSFNVFGKPIIWFKVRSIQVPSIYREFETNHLVGGTQHIRPSGYVASEFGKRIVPENQSIYGLGFSSQGFSEQYQIELHTRWVRTTGFATAGQQPSERYGTPRVWNKRQYIQHVYDSGDGLNPPSFGQWTAIQNRNKVMNVIGFSGLRFGYHQIDNHARPLLALGLDQSSIGRAMVSYRIRHLKPEAMDAPYISGWGRVFNAAAQIIVRGEQHHAWGKPSVMNTRREYRWVGAFESMLFGTPMVAFRIRKLAIESRYSIGPIYLPIPKVHLHTRYIDPPGSDLLAFGGINLHIKWNTFTPRWTHRELFGDATVRNVTPELKQRGNNSEVFGTASLRTQWRHLPMEGYGSELWGKTNIAYRDRSISITGFNAFRFGQHKVIRTGAPPYSFQNITLDWAGEGERPEGFDGNGIEIPKNQVPAPHVKSNVLFTEGFIATSFGSHHIQSNGILVYPGIQEMTIGEPAISLKNRVIEVPTMGDLLQLEDVKPRLSPHTIYAVNNAPQQAIKNHPTQGEIKYINDHGSHVGEIFGRVTVTLQHRKIFVGAGDELSMGRAQVFLSKRYIEPTGFLSFRMGWHNCLDGSPQTMVQYDSEDQSLFGEHLVKINYTGPQKILDRGFNSAILGATKIEFFNRPIYPKGYQATLMGTRLSGDTPYKPQGLWVGKPMPTIPDGFNAELFGDTTISLRVRDITAIGFDSFVSEMDISNFKGRMKVELVKKPVVIEPKEVFTQSFVNTNYGVPDIRLKTHYIRPDGNSDQYRKGGPT